MSEPQPNNPGQAKDAQQLRLADSSEGSTHHLGDANAEASQASASESAAKSAGASSTDGISTGGFETMIGKIVIDKGLATPEEIELCHSLMKESSADSDAEDPRTLVDMLVENDFVTKRQLDRLRNDFEAKKSTRAIPGYRIKEKLGSGAMATVFLARQLSLDRLVAIKVLPKKFSQNEKFIERFYKEGRAAAQLNHINIVAAYDVGKAGEHHYFVMEYVDGESVYDRLVSKKRFSEEDAISVVRQVALALEHAHGKGFIHRDIKPKNIMINKSGVVKLADLGLARAVSDTEAAKAEAGRAYGTPYYISPEQIRGSIRIGPPADLYGLGATFFHMVTGRVPFEGKNPSAVMHRHLKDELTPPDHLNPDISAGTALVIEMMMAKDAKERYQNASELLEDIELISNGQPPRYAKGGLDLSHIQEAAAAAQSAPVVDAPAASQDQSVSDPLSHPIFLIVLGVMLVSLLTNLILAAIMLT